MMAMIDINELFLQQKTTALSLNYFRLVSVSPNFLINKNQWQS